MAYKSIPSNMVEYHDVTIHVVHIIRIRWVIFLVPFTGKRAVYVKNSSL